MICLNGKPSWRMKAISSIEYTELWFHRKTADCLKKLSSKHGIALEVGIGKGEYLYLYRKEINLILGDINIKEELRGKIGNKMRICQLNLEKLPFLTRSLNIIILQKIIAHINNTKKARDEVHRTLKDNGILILSTVIQGPLGIGLHKNERGKRVLEKSHINEFKSIESLIDLFSPKFKVELTKKKFITFPIKKYSSKRFVEKFVFVFDKLILPVPFYYYDVLVILRKR